jgi:hypothetical protein
VILAAVALAVALVRPRPMRPRCRPTRGRPAALVPLRVEAAADGSPPRSRRRPGAPRRGHLPGGAPARPRREVRACADRETRPPRRQRGRALRRPRARVRARIGGGPADRQLLGSRRRWPAHPRVPAERGNRARERPQAPPRRARRHGDRGRVIDVVPRCGSSGPPSGPRSRRGADARGTLQRAPRGPGAGAPRAAPARARRRGGGGVAGRF